MSSRASGSVVRFRRAQPASWSGVNQVLRARSLLHTVSGGRAPSGGKDQPFVPDEEASPLQRQNYPKPAKAPFSAPPVLERLTRIDHAPVQAKCCIEAPALSVLATRDDAHISTPLHTRKNRELQGNATTDIIVVLLELQPTSPTPQVSPAIKRAAAWG